MNDTLEARPVAEGRDLSRWLGRRDAFGLMAGRCSAADVECLRQIRNQKLYVDVAPNWDEFCTRQLKVSRRKIDNDIRLLDEFGTVYHEIAQLTRITADEYRTIAPHVTADGVTLDGEVIALLPQNSDRLAEAVSTLRERVAPKPPRDSISFDAIVKRCDSVNTMLDATPAELDAEQKVALAAALCKMRELAARLGVILVEV